MVQSAVGMNGENKSQYNRSPADQPPQNRLDTVMGDLRETIAQPRPDSPRKPWSTNSKVHA